MEQLVYGGIVWISLRCILFFLLTRMFFRSWHYMRTTIVFNKEVILKEFLRGHVPTIVYFYFQVTLSHCRLSFLSFFMCSLIFFFQFLWAQKWWSLYSLSNKLLKRISLCLTFPLVPLLSCQMSDLREWYKTSEYIILPGDSNVETR